MYSLSEKTLRLSNKLFGSTTPILSETTFPELLFFLLFLLFLFAVWNPSPCLTLLPRGDSSQRNLNQKLQILFLFKFFSTLLHSQLVFHFLMLHHPSLDPILHGRTPMQRPTVKICKLASYGCQHRWISRGPDHRISSVLRKERTKVRC